MYNYTFKLKSILISILLLVYLYIYVYFCTYLYTFLYKKIATNEKQKKITCRAIRPKTCCI